ncbi:MAG: NUDIX hydrolase [Planctomycetota bacterium]
MHRNNLLQQLRAYQPGDQAQESARDRMIDFISSYSDCFDRSLAIGHITASSLLLDYTGTRCLLTHHRKLGKWLQPGGHADGDTDVLRVAMREAEEESGLNGIAPVSPSIFDVDIHMIPDHDGIPSHLHYDVRFLLRTTDRSPLVVSEESFALAWVDSTDWHEFVTDESVLRLFRKWQAMRGTPAFTI